MDKVTNADEYFSNEDDDVVEADYSDEGEDEDSLPEQLSPSEMHSELSSSYYEKKPNCERDDNYVGLEDTPDALKDNFEEDDNGAKNHNKDDGETNPTEIIINYGGPDDEDSSDDELLVNRKTLKRGSGSGSKVSKMKPVKKTAGTVNKGPKAMSKVLKDVNVRKRKAREVSTTKGIDNDEEEEEVMAAVVDTASECDSVDAEVIAVAEVVTKGHKKQSTPGRKKLRKRSPKHDSTPTIKVRRKPGPQPGWKKQKQQKKLDISSDESAQGQKEIPSQKREAAEKSRDFLLHSVEQLPFIASDSFIVRNFGRLKEETEKRPLEVLYSSPSALYPVGYSCDRYELSPIHGRLLKLRCEILDGSKYGNLLTENRNDNETEECSAYDGPIFRILWGRAIDEWEFDQSIPFDLNSITSSIGVSDHIKTGNRYPESGMRVKVRFDEDLWYKGVLGEVIAHGKKKLSGFSQNGNHSFTAQILYDDGSTEQIELPDPDVIILAQGTIEFIACFVLIFGYQSCICSFVKFKR